MLKKQHQKSTVAALAVNADFVGHVPQTRRRTKAAIQRIRDGLREILKADQPMSVRQVFYQAVVCGLIEKSEAEYKGTVCRLLALMRREEEIPYDWISDHTRWMRKPQTYSGLDQLLAATAMTYRRGLWASQDAYVEVWLEKEALAGVLSDVTEDWDVSLMVTKGYSSLSFLYSAAEAIAAKEKPAHLYYFGDHDPSGKDIPRYVEREIRRMAPAAEVRFEIVAVTPDQIRELKLPTRPTKQTDTRAASFRGRSTEVDAIPAPRLRALAEECITRHVNKDQLEATRRIEEEERKTLESIPELLRRGGRRRP